MTAKKSSRKNRITSRRSVKRRLVVIFAVALSVLAMSSVAFAGEVSYEGSEAAVLAVTKESGNVRLGEMQLKDGFNTISLYLEEKTENLEFVLSNATGEDIVVKKITFI